MPTRRRSIRSFRRGRRRQLVWARFFNTFTSAASGAFDLLADYRSARGVTLNDPGTTVAGILLNQQTNYDGTGNFTSSSGYNFGVYKDSAARTVAQLSYPATDSFIDWMWWQWVPYTLGNDSSAPTDTNVIRSAREYRIRSQRRLDEPGDTLWYTYDIGGIAGKSAISHSIGGAVLLRLP